MAYLFVHFTNGKNGDREHIWFSVSRDGLFFKDLGGDEPVLTSSSGTTGIRDPFIVYDGRLKRYFIIATDLCTVRGGNWGDFSQRGSRCLLVWESENLIDWSAERLVEVGIPEAGCVWAPETLFCEEEGKWFVFWASCVREKGETEPKQRIYASFTEDFISFTPAFKYIEASTAVIDTNIVRDKGWYYRFSKDETNKVIILERCKSLVPKEGESFEKIHSKLLSDFAGLEGPECYRLKNGKWCLIADQYRTGKGYLPLVCDELSTGEFYKLSPDEYNMGKRKKRHGGVIEISDEVAERLINYYGISE